MLVRITIITVLHWQAHSAFACAPLPRFHLGKHFCSVRRVDNYVQQSAEAHYGTERSLIDEMVPAELPGSQTGLII